MRDISLHILDIAQNSLSAGSSLIAIEVAAVKERDNLKVVITDNGCGMSQETLGRVRSPFTTSRATRDVGLGIPLFAASCESAGGALKITSRPGEGTRLCATLVLSHIDRPPLGDIAQTVAMLAVTNPQTDFLLDARQDEKAFKFDTRRVKQTLGQEVPVTQPDVSAFIQQYLQEGIRQVFGGIEI